LLQSSDRSVLTIVADGLQQITLPSLVRPNIPDTAPNEELVLWGMQYHAYSVIAHMRVVYQGFVSLLEVGNVPAAFPVARHIFEWTAHCCYMSRNLKNYIERKEWGRAWHLHGLAMLGNKWIKDHGLKYAPELISDTALDPLSVPNIVNAYEEYQIYADNLGDAKDTYGLLSEHSHANGACFLAYYEYDGLKVSFVNPSSNPALLSKERYSIHLMLFLEELLALGEETNVRRNIRRIILQLTEIKI
jgi:hypothetical protein